jgi:NhaA family Na+:H+ antiporter
MSVTRTQTVGGAQLIGATAAALIWANTSASESYQSLAHQEWLKGLAIFAFFLSVGIELRHEVKGGSLAKPKQAIVPIFAAIGGMTVPVLIYSMLNAGLPTAVGWGVPMSTDIAFALAVFAIVARGLPRQIRTFVMTVAVVDDSLTILMIAIFFAASFHLLSLVSLAGVICGLLIPFSKAFADRLQPIVAFGALPLFALLSAGVNLENIPAIFFASSITIGVLVAMILGKPLGVLGTTWMVTKSRLGKLPDEIKWADLLPVGFLFGMCFTVSLLMSELSFAANQTWHDTANLSVFIGSVTSALIGAVAIKLRIRSRAAN